MSNRIDCLWETVAHAERVIKNIRAELRGIGKRDPRRTDLLLQTIRWHKRAIETAGKEIANAQRLVQ